MTSSPTPTAAEAKGMLKGLMQGHACGEACVGKFTLGDGTVVDLTCPYSRLDPNSPADARIIQTMYAEAARAALRSGGLLPPTEEVSTSIRKRIVELDVTGAPDTKGTVGFAQRTLRPERVKVTYEGAVSVEVTGRMVKDDGGLTAVLFSATYAEPEVPVWTLAVIEEHRA